jgi:hypothetical protein
VCLCEHGWFGGNCSRALEGWAKMHRLEHNFYEHDAFKSRYVLAAHHLRHCRHIVEIGGYRTPISSFLRSQHESVTTIDPYIKPLAADSPTTLAPGATFSSLAFKSPPTHPASRHFHFQVHSGNKTMTFTISQDKKGGGRVRPVKTDDSDSDSNQQRVKDPEVQKRQRRSANKFLSKVPRK